METTELARRAAIHAALGEPVRLAIVDELTASDRSPGELGARLGVAGNLLAHHLDVLEQVGLVERTRSTADGRRRYVRLRRTALADLGPTVSAPTIPSGPVLFVCSRNSARSQLAAALWRTRTGRPASSAGTHPADRVHPGAVGAARRARLDLADARPRRIGARPVDGLVVTVCDRAHEELAADPDWWHWSLVDPVVVGDDRAFDATVRDLDERIRAVLVGDDAGAAPPDSDPLPTTT